MKSAYRVKSGSGKFSGFKPGSTIPKFNIGDLPQVTSFDDALFEDFNIGGNFDIKINNNNNIIDDIGGKKFKKQSETSGILDKLMSTSERIKSSMKSDIGFGFTSKSTRDELDSIQERILEQKKKFKETTSSRRSDKNFDKTPNSTIGLKNIKAEKNAKLAEIAQIFRESLQKTEKDPKEVISLPQKSETSIKKPSKSKSPADRLKKNQFPPAPKKITFKSPPPPTPSTQTLNLKQKTGEESKKQSKNEGKNEGKNESGFSTYGLVELRKLLAHDRENLTKNSTTTSPLDPIEYTRGKIRENRLKSIEAFGPKLVSNSKSSVKFSDYLVDTKIDDLGSKMIEKSSIDPKVALLNRKKEEKRGLQTLVTQRFPLASTEVIEKKLEKSKGILNAVEKQSGDIGTFMKKISESRKSLPFENSQNSPKDKLSLLAERVENLCLGDEEGDGWRKLKNSPAKTQTSHNQSTETGDKMMKRLKMPEIIFKKDMSEADEKKLKELRAMKESWDKVEQNN